MDEQTFKDALLRKRTEILGTGGGIKNARKYLESSDNFLVYNVDVESGIDISKMFGFHVENNPLATLAVKNRITSRYLLIDEKQRIIGRRIKEQDLIFAEPFGEVGITAFCGVHIISARIFELFPNEAQFDIVSFYMDLIENGNRIIGYDVKDAGWEDLGKI